MSDHEFLSCIIQIRSERNGTNLPKDRKQNAKHQDATTETRQLPIIIKPREALLTLIRSFTTSR